MRNLIRKLIWPEIAILLLGIVNLSPCTILCFKEDGRIRMEISVNGYQCQPCSDASSPDLMPCDVCIDIPIANPGAASHSTLQRELPEKVLLPVAVAESFENAAVAYKADHPLPLSGYAWLSPPLTSIRSTILLI